MQDFRLEALKNFQAMECENIESILATFDQFLEDERNRGASSRLKNIGAYVVKLPELSFENAAADAVDASQLSAVNFVQHVLQQQRRRLQPFQLESLRTQVMNFDFVGENSKYNLQTSSPAYVKMLALQARRIHNLESRPLLRLNRCLLACSACSGKLVCNFIAVGALALAGSWIIACLTLQKNYSGPNLSRALSFASHHADSGSLM